jgi:hypothetical protein
MSEINTNANAKVTANKNSNKNSKSSLEVGKYYLDGLKRVHYLTHTREENDVIYYCSDDFLQWDENGCYFEVDHPSQFDLIHEVEVKIVNNIKEDKITKEKVVDKVPAINIEVGKTYLDREGRAHFVSKFDPDSENSYFYKSNTFSWLQSGWYIEEGVPSDFDLIREVNCFIVNKKSQFHQALT